MVERTDIVSSSMYVIVLLVGGLSAAVFLTNRIPSTVLANQLPFYVLYRKIPNYTKLRAFRCACYPNLRPYNAHKFSFHSTKCVFLGYSG